MQISLFRFHSVTQQPPNISKRALTAICSWLFCLTAGLAQPLADRLQTLIEQASLLQTSEIGVAVYDLTAGSPVYTYQSKKLYRPASIEKIITCVTALDRLGAEYPMNTRLYYTGTVKDSTLVGDLYVKGGFDMLFNENDLQTLVAGVRKLGIRQITGTLYGDVSLKDSLYFGEGWSWDDAQFDFQPSLSPLTCNRGCVRISCIPGFTGEPATVNISPNSGYYTLYNHSVSHTPAAGKLGITRSWTDQTNVITVSGNVTNRTIKSLPLSYPEYFFLHLLTERLQQAGIRTNDYALATVPLEANELTFVSRHMKDILQEALKESDNLAAEAIFYTLATLQANSRPAKAQDAIEQINEFIRELGYNPENYNIADGSGVSLYNYVSPELMIAFLRYAYANESIFKTFFDALPTAGIDGTLAHRLYKTAGYRRIHAKTGTVKGVCSLAGYAQASNNHLLAFVIINQNALKASQARALQDKLCVELCK